MLRKTSHRYLALAALMLTAYATSCGSDDGPPTLARGPTASRLAAGPLEPGEQLGENHFILSFGRESSGNDSLDGTGVHLHGAVAWPPGASLRFFNGATSQNNGVYDIAFKNDIGHPERISSTMPNIVPRYGSPLAGEGSFDGTALWLGHSRFRDGGAPTVGTDSPPTEGTLWDGGRGPAERGTDVRVDDQHLVSIPVVQNEVTRRSYLVSAQVYAPAHEPSGHRIRPQPFIAREAGGALWGLTVPGGLGLQQIDLTSVPERWRLLQVRADISTDGGSLPDPSDDSGQVMYRYFLDGEQVGDPVTVAFEPAIMRDPTHTGAVRFGPAFGLSHGWSTDAPEVFLDDIALDTITGSTSEFVITSPQVGTVGGVTPLRVSLGSVAPRVASVEYSLGSHSLGIEWSPPYSLDWNSRFVDDGRVRLIATARDAMGNVLQSAQRDIVVRNIGNEIEIVQTDQPLDEPLKGTLHLKVRGIDSQYFPYVFLMYIDGQVIQPFEHHWTNREHAFVADLSLDTTRLRNGTHEFFIHVHSQDGNGGYYNNRIQAGPRRITIDNPPKVPKEKQEIALDWLHVYLNPGESKTLTCTQHYADGAKGSCSNVAFRAEPPGIVDVDANGNVKARDNVEGFATVTASVGETPTDKASARVWVRPNRHVVHFGKDGSFLTSYTPDKSLYVTSPHELAPWQPQNINGLLEELKKAGINTLNVGFYPNPYNVKRNFNCWKADFLKEYPPQWEYAKGVGFNILFGGDAIVRVRSLDAWTTLNWSGDPSLPCPDAASPEADSLDGGSGDGGPSTPKESLGRLAVTYALQSAAEAGVGLGIEMVDETSMFWGATPYPKAKVGDPCMFQSINCYASTDLPTGKRCRVNWPIVGCHDDTIKNALRTGDAKLERHFVLLNSTKGLTTPAGTTFTAIEGTIDPKTGFEFDAPAEVAVGETYHRGNDENLEWSLFWPVEAFYGSQWCGTDAGNIACDPHIPNDAIATISSWMRDGGSPRLNMTWPTLGISDMPQYNPEVPGNWYGKGAPADYASHYYDSEDLRDAFPWAWSVHESSFWMRNAFYRRQRMMDLSRPQIMVTSLSGIEYRVGSTQTPHARSYEPGVDELTNVGTSSEAVVVDMLTAAAIGNVGSRLFKFENPDLWDKRRNEPKGNVLIIGANPYQAEVSHWRAMAYGANMLTKVLAPYLLADFRDAPALGRDVVTAARQGSDARMFLAVNERDWPQELDIDLAAVSPSRFGVLRYRVGPHGIDVTRLPDGIAADHVALGIGEGVAYLLHAAPDGASGKVVEEILPGELPPRATSAVLRTSYIYADELTKRTGGGSACQVPCTVLRDPRLGDLFYQYTFLDADGAIVGKSSVFKR